MENDLISRNAMFDAMRDAEFQTFVPLDEVDEVIANVPAIDAEPVRHGRWIEVWCFDYMDYTHYCSECHYDALTKEGTMHDEVLTSYCPNCGARMRGDANGE